MSALSKIRTIPRAATDGLPRSSSRAPRAVPFITLGYPQPDDHSYNYTLGFGLALIFIVGIFQYLYGELARLENILPLIPVPAAVEPPDMEALEPYAETILPPPEDVIVPAPVVADMPLPAPLENLQPAVTLPDPTLLDGIKLAAGPDQTLSSIADTQPKAEPAAIIDIRGKDSSDDHRLDEAQALLNAGDDNGALTMYDQILTQDKTDRAALIGKAFVLQITGQYEAAVTVNRRLLTLDPHDDTALMNLIAVLGAWGTPQALAELKRMTEIRPGFAPAQEALAEALATQGDMGIAISPAHKAAQMQPNNILYRLDLAIMYDRAGRRAEAAGLYRQVLRAYDMMDARATALPASLADIRQRADYLEQSGEAEKLPSQ